MSTIALFLIALAALSLFAIIIAGVKRTLEKHKPQIKLFEPDIPLVERPDLVAKIPENENKIPDSNDSGKNSDAKILDFKTRKKFG